MRKKSSNFIVDLVVYPFDVMVSIGETNQEFLKKIKKYCHSSVLKELEDDPVILTMPSTTNGRTINFVEAGQTIVRIRKHPVTCYDYSVLAHEIFHAVEYIMIRIGMKHSLDSSEAYAYLIGYLTEQIYKKIQ